MINKGAVVIPARYQSSRFPGKPTADINGKPMIRHVYERCVAAVGGDRVYVATDDISIKKVVESFSGQVVMTSSECLTGTDRLAEANELLNLDFLVNVQGDEPMIDPSSIKSVFNAMTKDTSQIINCYCDINSDEINMPSIPKVVVSCSGRLIYMSRGGCPFDKSGVPMAKYKQVCIYGFSRAHLEIFKARSLKTLNEGVEDIEILRFLDLDYSVQMIQVAAGGVAVDTPQDLARVRILMENKS
tara:strand:+ start:92 stop:823 length:732 start_codon:yes stop_codon:yes gene_type:complete